jgi:hypothetical protein
MRGSLNKAQYQHLAVNENGKENVRDPKSQKGHFGGTLKSFHDLI